MLGKLPVQSGDYSRARAYCTGVIWIYFSAVISVLSPSLWETARYRLKYCLKGPLNSKKQQTNQPLIQEGQFVSYWPKYVLLVLVNHLGGLSLPGNTVVRLTDRPDITIVVYHGRKATK